MLWVKTGFGRARRWDGEDERSEEVEVPKGWNGEVVGFEGYLDGKEDLEIRHSHVLNRGLSQEVRKLANAMAMGLILNSQRRFTRG